MRKNLKISGKLLILATILFVGFSLNSRQFQAPNTTPGMQLEEGLYSQQPEQAYIRGLEQSLEILKTTNEALTQKWTPINISLTILSSLFAIITILWGIVFAFGVVAYKQMQDNKKLWDQEINSATQLTNQKIGDFQAKTENLIEQIKEKKKSVEEAETEFQKLKLKMSSDIDRIQSRTHIPQGIVSNAYIPPLKTVGFSSFLSENRGTQRECSKCHTLFMDYCNDTNDLLMSHRFANILGETEQNYLCNRCRNETEQVISQSFVT